MTERRISVVTGGASGIGRATAKRLAEAGDLVVLADLNETGGQSVVGEIETAGGQAEFQLLDVAEEASVTALAASVERAHGIPHVLVNCAGLLQNVHRVANQDLEEHDRIWAVNYRGLYLCCRAFGPRMADAGRGSIVNISSTSAIAAFPLIAYAPGKAAVSHLTRLLASDLGRDGVRVNAIVPGYVLTEQMQSRIDSGHRDQTQMAEQSALGRMIEPSEIADGVHFLCSDAARAITGIDLPIDGGWTSYVTYTAHPGWPPRD